MKTFGLSFLLGLVLAAPFASLFPDITGHQIVLFLGIIAGVSAAISIAIGLANSYCDLKRYEAEHPEEAHYHSGPPVGNAAIIALWLVYIIVASALASTGNSKYWPDGLAFLFQGAGIIMWVGFLPMCFWSVNRQFKTNTEAGYHPSLHF